MSDFRTKFGQFSENGQEYVIRTPRTPRPWINVISNGDYGLTVSQTGSGYSWRTHAQLNRITRWEQDLIKDEWGKYIYLRDERGNVWSAGWKPVCKEPDSYRCRHGLGYSAIESTNEGIESELVMFVPPGDPVEVWKLTLRNNSRKKRRIDAITYFEWGLGQSPDWHREFHKSFIQTKFDVDLQAILATKFLWEVPTPKGHWNTDWPYVAFHSCSMKPRSYDTNKESFLGMYGSVSKPESVSSGKLSKQSARGLDAIGSLHARVELAPSETKTILFTLGAADSQAQARELVLKYRRPEEVDRAFAAVGRQWREILGTVEVKTPDEAMNIMQNIWLKYQTISGRMWGRTAYYQTGGAYGFRDQLQDSQLWLQIDALKTLGQLRLHARHQFKDGTVYHWWHPLSETGLHSKISDNFLWLPYVMHSYLLETGDVAALDVREPWVDDKNEASLYDHCIRSIDLSLSRISARGLPLIGAGDWNDGLSAVGLEMKGESVWLGHFLHRILIDFSCVCERKGESAKASDYRAKAGVLKERLNDAGWDGEWYLGATKDSGERLGSRENSEGSLWLNPQTWAVIGDVADEKRGSQVMDTVERELETEIGPLLLRPAYKTPDQSVGYLTRYAPGMRENGGVYTHGATWAVIAAARLGRGESAFRIYSKLNPINRGKNPPLYKAEPYVTSGSIEGPDSPDFGRGGWTWYSGSSSWLFRVGLEWILGVRPSWDGLLIDPCIPPQWKQFTVRRRFRGAEYKINVVNPEGVACGVKELKVNGKPQVETKSARERVIPPAPAGSVVEVQVTMGKT